MSTELFKGDLVEGTSMGYKGVRFFVVGLATPDRKDGAVRYSVRKEGKFTELVFRRDELSLIQRGTTGHAIADGAGNV